MSTASRAWAFIAYLLFIVGWLLVVLFRRNDPFALYHARQSLRLTLILAAAVAVWAVVAYVLAFIPLVGALISVASFSIVILVFLGGLIAWIGGMVNALRSMATPMPVMGG